MKDSLNNMFSLDVKVTFDDNNVWKKQEKVVSSSQNLSLYYLETFCNEQLVSEKYSNGYYA